MMHHFIEIKNSKKKYIKKYRNQLMFCVLYNPFYSETGIIYVRHFNKIVL